jgi:gamma-glutamyltranspeptidase/glutathione hydrolase
MDYDWHLPYPSRRQPIFARNAVATSQPLATQAGIAMLVKGGNAVDAALATAITLTLVEPCSNGLGSDLFAILWTGSELVGLNASGRAPQAWTPARFAGRTAMHERGWETVTIPGAVSGWRALSQRFGTVPFADLFEPAIRYARDGFLVSPIVAEKWALAVPHMPRDLGWFEHFMPRGRAPHPGERFASPAMAATLEKIARTDGEAFYRGELADAMVRHARSAGAAHTLADFAAHTNDWVAPLGLDYRDSTVHEIPPNGQGIAALMALGILENFDLRAMPPDSAATQHLEIEAMKLAFADAHRYVSDPRTMPVPASALLDRAYLAARARKINPAHAQDFGPGEPPKGGTCLPVRRRQERHDGVADPVELHGLRRGRRGPGNRHQPAESRDRFFAAARAPQRSCRRQAALSHDHPGFRHAQWRAAGGVWRDGRSDSAAWPRADAGAAHRLQDESASGARCAAMESQRGPIDRSRGFCASGIARRVAGDGHTMASVPDSYMDFGAGQFIVRTDDGYIAASDPRRDGQAAGF